MTESTEKVIETLMPKVTEALEASLNGKLAEKLPALKDSIRNELWDSAVAEIGRQLNLPKEIIEKLQSLDDMVGSGLEEMHEKLLAFQDRLKGVDLNKTITMSYGALQKIKVKAAAAWGLVCLGLGFLGGLVAGLAF